MTVVLCFSVPSSVAQMGGPVANGSKYGENVDTKNMSNVWDQNTLLKERDAMLFTLIIHGAFSELGEAQNSQFLEKSSLWVRLVPPRN